MNREIKFRAWDGKTFINFSIWGVPSVIYGSSEEHFKIVQFTGLLDRLGKEIYEGDILESNHPDELKVEGARMFIYVDAKEAREAFKKNPGTAKPNRIIVKWIGDSENDYIGFNFGSVDPHDVCKKYEIIGNIYENPELLKNST